jgi:hypothetical protein
MLRLHVHVEACLVSNKTCLRNAFLIKDTPQNSSSQTCLWDASLIKDTLDKVCQVYLCHKGHANLHHTREGT